MQITYNSGDFTIQSSENQKGYLNKSNWSRQL